MTQCGFNRRQRVGFNYRLADLEMKAGAVRCCISMVLAARHSYEPLLDITMLLCQAMSKASVTPTKVRASSDRAGENLLFTF